jgi:hypothetical protein
MVRASCARSLRQAVDAGNERPIRSAGHTAAAYRSSHLPGTEHVGCLNPGGPLGTVASSSARHGWVRRNALSPHGVRISGVPGAPFWIGYSSANRSLAGKLLWDGIVAVPKVFDAGCFALFLDRRERPAWRECVIRGRGRAIQPPGRSPTNLPGLRTQVTHGGTQSVAGNVDIRRLSEQRESTLAPTGAAVPGRRA